MMWLEKLKGYCYKIATLGQTGRWWFGGIFASVLALPLIILGRFLYEFNSSFFWWVVGILLILSYLIVFLATKYISAQYPAHIVIDKIIGVIITFAFVPLHWKIVLFGFILFHIINFLRPVIFCKTLGENIEKLPMGIGIILGDVISGVVSNLFLQLIIWIVT